MRKTSKIYVAGHNGLVGSAIVRKLKDERHKNILTFSHSELDLTNKADTETMFRLYRPSYVFLAAAKVGGIHDNNTKSGEYFYDNIQIQTNVMEAARKYGTKKLLFLGSSCIYPKYAEQPIKEESLMTAPLEQTNSAYAMAKIAGIEMCKAYRKQYGSNFISAMPSNLYGPCFSGDTDVLTKGGIKNIKDIKVGDPIYTLNPATLEMEECKVSHIQKEYTTDEYISFQSRGADFLVTPDHNMFYRTSTGYVKRKAEYFRERAGNPFGQIVFAHHTIADRDKTKQEKTINLDYYTDSDHIISDGYVRDYKHSLSKKFPLTYNKADFFEFLGWYITEGSLVRSLSSGGKWSIPNKLVGRIQISQYKSANPENWNRIFSLLERMKIPFYYNDHGFYFSSRLFSNFIMENIGLGSKNKRIPSFVFLEREFQNMHRLFESMILGDGHKNQNIYSTSSPKLKEDFMHLCFLLGIKANTTKKNHRVYINYTNVNTTVKYKNIEVKKTSGEPVYCITAEKNHIIYAGRNHKFNWVGQCDNFNIPGSHVLPAFIRRFHEAKINGTSPVEIWGDGTPLREFLHVDDLAEALMLLMHEYNSPQHINIGAGYDVPIKFIAKMIADIIGYEGEIVYNREYPNGTPKKLLDSSKIRELGWETKIALEDGIKSTYKWFVENYDKIRK